MSGVIENTFHLEDLWMENRNDSSCFTLLDDESRAKLASSISTYRERFRKHISLHDIEEIRERASAIRDESLKNASELWKSAESEMRPW